MSDLTLTAPDPFAHAMALFRAGRLHDAEALCTAIAKTGDHFDTLYLLANIQFRPRRPNDALANYEAALALNPEHPQALMRMRSRATIRRSPSSRICRRLNQPRHRAQQPRSHVGKFAPFSGGAGELRAGLGDRTRQSRVFIRARQHATGSAALRGGGCKLRRGFGAQTRPHRRA
jgi:hypothetical protein